VSPKDIASPSPKSAGRKAVSRFKTAAAYNLREFSKKRCTLRSEPLEPVATPRGKSQSFVDVDGQTGGWRQRRAQRDLASYSEQTHQERLMKRQSVALQMLESEREKENEESEQRQLRELDEEKDRQKHRLQEQRIQERLRQHKERENIAALNKPRLCTTCNGLKTCQMCNGTGCREAIYLAATVTNEDRFYGRTFCGCEMCGGAEGADVESGDQELCKGTGQCHTCNGTGETWPTPDEIDALIEQELDGFKPGIR